MPRPTVFATSLLALFFTSPAIAQERYCREYTKNIVVNGIQQKGYGTACLQPDGSWQIVSDGEPRPLNNERGAYLTNKRVYINEPTHVIHEHVYREPARSGIRVVLDTLHLFSHYDRNAFHNRRHHKRHHYRHHGEHQRHGYHRGRHGHKKHHGHKRHHDRDYGHNRDYSRKHYHRNRPKKKGHNYAELPHGY